MKKKICWVTASYFLDVDLPVVPKLMNKFIIDWYIITTSSQIKSDREYIQSKTSKPYNLIISNNKFYSFALYLFYKDFIKQIKSKRYDWYYFDISDYFFLFPLIKYYIGNRNVTIATHNVSTPKGARLPLLAKLSMYYIRNRFKYFQVFSRNQEQKLKNKIKNINVFYCPLMLKDYGPAKERTRDGITRFLFFGNIIPYKRLDLLLKACNVLGDKGVRNFRIDIAGYCKSNTWEKFYLPMIKYPELINLDIRRIPNDIVCDYFGNNDYFVMPYQDIAQSGAMTVALNYNLPIIASDLDTFKEYISHKLNSYIFESGNVNALVAAMEWAMKNTQYEYNLLKINLEKMVKETLSEQIILNKYEQYFIFCLNA